MSVKQVRLNDMICECVFFLLYSIHVCVCIYTYIFSFYMYLIMNFLRDAIISLTFIRKVVMLRIMKLF